jgi:hypothetical protein
VLRIWIPTFWPVPVSDQDVGGYRSSATKVDILLLYINFFYEDNNCENIKNIVLTFDFISKYFRSFLRKKFLYKIYVGQDPEPEPENVRDRTGFRNY